MLKEEPKVKEASDAKQFLFKHGHIEFKNVSFGHKVASKNQKAGYESLDQLQEADEGE